MKLLCINEFGCLDFLVSIKVFRGNDPFSSEIGSGNHVEARVLCLKVGQHSIGFRRNHRKNLEFGEGYSGLNVLGGVSFFGCLWFFVLGY